MEPRVNKYFNSSNKIKQKLRTDPTKEELWLFLFSSSIFNFPYLRSTINLSLSLSRSLPQSAFPHRLFHNITKLDMDPVKWMVGIGFWVQGFRCFPWLGVNFFLKDALGVPPSSLQLLQNSANLPMVAKPLYGLLSDSVPIHGQRRLPYVAIGGTCFVAVDLLHYFSHFPPF